MDEPTAAHWDREVLNQIWEERMALCYKPLLLLSTCDHCDAEGRANVRTLAEYFSRFFQNRRETGKVEENPNRFPTGNLPSDRSLSQWEYEIRQEPLRRISKDLLVDEDPTVCWAEDHWTSCSVGFKKALRNTAETRLIEYFETYVP